MESIDISSLHIEIAVAIVVFNRLDCVMENIDTIRKAAPPRLYVISDGSRENLSGEDEKVREVREYIETHVDWDCELIKIYSDQNMGCDRRSVTGYDEVFEREDVAILIEDDAIVDPSFFPFCEAMLRKYHDDDRVMMISSSNMIPEYSVPGCDYFFSAVPMKYVWGTWRRAWKWHGRVCAGKFEINRKWINKALQGKTRDFYMGSLYHLKMRHGLCWDAEWDCAMLTCGSVGIVPYNHLMKYIGSNREDATHMSGESVFDRMETKPLRQEIRMRDDVVWDKEYDYKVRPYLVTLDRRFYIRAWVSFLIYRISPGLHNRMTILTNRGQRG